MRRKKVLFLFMLLLLVYSIIPLHNSYAASWYNANWLYRQKITILPTLADADLTNFPYLFKITNGANPFFASAQADHDDILFTKSDGVTKLDHEIEYYESASGSEELDAWVQVESLSSTANTEIYMYYGNALVGNQENVSGVWSNDYEAVYHLHDDFNDSLAAHNGSNSGSSDVVGQIADAQDFDPGDGSNDEIHLGTWSVSGSALTIEAWIKSDDGFVTDDPRVISKAQSSGAVEDHVYMMSLNDGTLHENRLRFRLKTGTSDTSGTTTFFGTSPNGYLPDANQWYHVAMTYDNSQMRIIRDGHDAGSTPKTGILRENTWPVSIGNIPSGTYGAWDGKIDEVRISKTARGLEWIAASYRNQNSPDTYQALSPEEQAYNITGTVFEDVVITGGVGEPFNGGEGDAGISGVRVELFDAANVFLAFTTTDGSGNYSFSGLLGSTSYTIRVVGSTVDAGVGALAEQTFESDGTTNYGGFGIAMGGQNAAVADTATQSTLSGAEHWVLIAVGTAEVSGVDFGFSYDLIVNTNDSDQGSLRQFINNANLIAGVQASEFNIPTSDPNYNGTGNGEFTIQTSTALPTITDNGTHINGGTQTSNIGNTNAGSIGTGGTVGVDAVSLPSYERPEVAINGGGGNIFTIDGNASDITLEHLALYHSVNAITGNGGSGTNRIIRYNLVGTLPDGTDPGGIDRNQSYGVNQQSGGEMTVTSNYLAWNGRSGILGVSNDSVMNVSYNEVFECGWNSNGHDGIDVDGINSSIRYNLVHNQRNQGAPAGGGSGIEIGSRTSLVPTNNVVENNTVHGCDLAGIMLRKGSIGNTVSKNIVHSNNVGIYVNTEGRTTNNNKMSQNSIYNNDALGIDLVTLDSSTAGGDGVTSNDTGDADTGSNNLLNFPVIESVPLDTNTNTLILKGFARPGSIIEFFIATTDPSGFGEGQTYLVTLVEGSVDDLDNTTGSYSDPQAGSDTTNRFHFEIPVPGGVSVGTVLTATATDGGSNTSEFCENATAVEMMPDILMVKSVQTFSDPYNGETNPKAIPGAVMLYTVAATNQGVGATDADTVVITDPIPANTALFVGDIAGAGSGPVLFTDGTPPNDSGLSYAFISLNNLTDDVIFSNDGGATYTYVPAPDGDGFDANVTHMRINPTGTFKAASGGDIPTFDVKFKVQVE